ncbi:hypothetical protein Taro_038195 [Colocasia esculenta]|uniref:ZCF37 n=1 Tax=Colocasia esculenta TaxID=4460 RepID=A0A843W2R1_COLES|nr:hypothetical protein [Colocasia esculenta]
MQLNAPTQREKPRGARCTPTQGKVDGGKAILKQGDEGPSPPKPGGSRRKHGCSNPYATRGLLNFSMVLADLQARREKVMAQEGASLVRFVYSNSHDWIPIVVKVPSQKQPQPENPRKCPPGESQKKPDAAVAAPNRAAVKRGFSWKVRGLSLEGWRWHPSYYWPVVVALILLCLVFGRSFAICCTSIGWYLLPCISGDESLDERKSMKKDYRRRASEKKPLGAGSGEGAVTPALGKKEGNSVGLASPRRHRKSHAAGKQREAKHMGNRVHFNKP